MKHQKLFNLLNEPNHSIFMTRKWNLVDDLSNVNYSVGNEVIYSTEDLKSNFCDYNDAYILVRGDIIVTVAPATEVSFKNCAPFTKCITKVDGTTIDDAEDLDLVMPMYNLKINWCKSQCISSNFSETTGSLWFYSKDEATYFNANVANDNDFKSFKYNAKLLGNAKADGAN